LPPGDRIATKGDLMDRISRRVLLGGAAATAGVLPLPRWLVHTARAQTQATRHDLSSSEGQAMLRIYAETVGKMMAMGEGEPRGWLFQWYTHAVRGDRTKAAELRRVYSNASDPNRALADSVWDTCQAHFDDSRSRYFLPWHRMYVLFFEQIIRNVSGNAAFTLPYWDYTDRAKRALPEQFRMRNDPVWGPLFRPERNNGVNAGRPIDQVGGTPINLDDMRSPVYADTGTGDAGFCSNLDQGLHGAVHVDVGNERAGMGDVPWAANDPIFWMHHCNIDRIWASWNKAGGKNPGDSGFVDETFTFADGSGSRVQSKVGDVLDTAQLNYVYDRYLDRPPASAPFPQPGAVVAFAAHASSRQVSGPVALGATPTSVSLASPAAPAAKAAGPSLAASARAGRNFYLRLDGLRAATQPGIAYDVYLDLPEGTTPGRDSPHYVGSANFFGAVLHGAHAGHGPAPASKRSYSLVATQTVRKLQEAGRLTETPRVTLVPTGAPREGAAPTITSIALLSSS
jgi:hypothetical protein